MSLKVFDLQCEHGHVFEGWFASSDAYESQKAGGLLSCPVCHSAQVVRKLSAARLNVSHLKRERLGNGRPNPDTQPRPATDAGVAAVAAEPASSGTVDVAALQAQMIRHVRKVLKDTENVGIRFAEESRRIHYGDAEERAIRGTATREERAELAEEGIAVHAIPDIFDDDRLQ